MDVEMCWCENVEMLLLAGMLDNKEIHILTFLIPAAYLHFVPVCKPAGRFPHFVGNS